MSILRTHNLQNPDSSSINIVMDQGGNTNITGVTTVGSNFHVTSGSVGIGTDNPGSNKLQVQGGSAFYGNGGASATWGDTSYLGALSFDGSAQPVIRAASSKALIFQVNQSTESLRLKSDGKSYFTGNIGVGGLTNPGALLSIPAGESNTPRLAIESAVDDNDFTITQYEDGNGTYTMLGQNVKLNSGGNNTVLDSAHRTAGILLDARNHGAITFLTGGANAVGENVKIDSGGRLLVGTTSLIDSSTASNFQIASASGPRLCIARNNTNVTGGNLMGALDFYGNDSDGNYEICGRMILEADGTHTTDAKPTRMAFYTTPSGSDIATERLRITADGKLRVPDSGRFTCGNSDDLALRHSGTTGVLENNTGSFYIDQHLDDGDIYIRSDNGSGGSATYFQASGGDGQARLFHYGTKKFHTLSNGTQTTGRIYLNGTNGGFDYNNTAHTLEFLVANGSTHSELNSNAYVPSASGTRNLGASNKRWDTLYVDKIAFGGSANTSQHSLDDYEEGTWTPTYQNFSTTGTSTLVGKYVKVGRQVTVGIKWSCTGTIAHSTSAFISLPFSMTYGQEYNGLIGMLLNNNGTSQTSGKSGVQCKLDGEGGSRFFPGSFTTTSSGEVLLFGGTYIAAS